MNFKSLNQLHDYVLMLQKTYGDGGWSGPYSRGIPVEVPGDIRLFFEYTQLVYPFKDFPFFEIIPCTAGAISFEFERLNPSLTLDFFGMYFTGNGAIDYTAELQSLGTFNSGSVIIEPEIDPVLFDFINFFK